jgi:hypothetical protein
MNGDNQGLSVHDVSVAQQTGIDGKGKPQVGFVVTFSVGSHGPFTEVIGKSGDPKKDSDAIKAAIQNHVQLLRAVTHPEQG